MTNSEARALEIAGGRLGWYLLATKTAEMHGCVVQAFGIHDALHQAKLLRAIDARHDVPIAVTDWLSQVSPRPSVTNRRLDQAELLELCRENLT